ncbi:hypothetical protein EPO17_01650, partial [Patescibacteria group bacterium]
MQWFKNIIEKVNVALNFNRVNSPNLKIKTYIENNAEQVGTQIGQVNIQQGLSYTEAKDLIVSVIDQKMIAF